MTWIDFHSTARIMKQRNKKDFQAHWCHFIRAVHMDEQSILQQGQTCQFQSEKKKKEKKKASATYYRMLAKCITSFG